MATSGTTTWNLEIDEIIEEALERVGGEHISGNEAKSARRSLNLLFRELETRGYPLARLEIVTVPMVDGTQDYTLDEDVVAVMDLILRRDNIDLSMTRLSLFDFNRIAKKTQEGRPTQYTTDRDRDAITMSVWPIPDNSTDTVRGWVVKRIEDASRSTQTLDLNVRFLPAIVAGLAYHMSYKRKGVPIEYRTQLKQEYEELLQRALDEDRERTSLFAVPKLNM
jgi:hypothetical protein